QDDLAAEPVAPEAADQPAVIVHDGDDLVAVRTHEDRVDAVAAALDPALLEAQQALGLVMADEDLSAVAHDEATIGLLDDDPAAGLDPLVPLLLELLHVDDD